VSSDAYDDLGVEYLRGDSARALLERGLFGHHLALVAALKGFSAATAPRPGLDDEHITTPITFGVSRSEHSAERPMHVKQVL
jgi:hypothetical protein